MIILHVGQTFEDALGSKYARVLNILFGFVSSALRLLIISRVRHVLYGDSSLTQQRIYIDYETSLWNVSSVFVWKKLT